MKKISQRLLAAAVVAAVGVSASAEVLSPEQALSRALPQGRMAAPALTTPVLAYTAVADELPAVYVFAKENKGFMLVSADDAVTPLLGYSDNGSFDAENMAPEFKYWVDEYSRQIAYIRDNNLEPKTERIARPERAEIEPLCKTKWNQDAPYNLLCPTGTYPGCVATAAAQVMKYFNYPKTALGSDAKFKTTVSGSSTPFEIDCEGWVFQWDKMLDVYSGTVSKESKEAVAQLMVAIGGAVDMNYGDASVGGSGAQTIKVGGAAVKYFGYDKGVQYLSRDCYTLSDWENIIYEQLSTVGPVLYDGRTINNEGHAYVVDGYQGDGMFHLNWGWGGTSDGYFLLDCLDPYEQGAGGAASGAGFNYGQDITINLRPDQGGEFIPNITAVGTGLTMTPGYFNLGRAVSVGFGGASGQGFFNHSYGAITGLQFGLHIVGEGQDFYRWDEVITTPIETNYGRTSYNVMLAGVKENSSYIVTPAFRVGDYIAPIDVPYGTVRSYQLKTTVTHGTLTPITSDLEVSDVQLLSVGNNPEVVEVVKRNANIKLTGKLSNNSDVYYYGHVAPAILAKELGAYSIVRAITNFTVSLDAGESMEWSQNMRFTNSVGLTDGQDYYYGFVDPESGRIIGSLTKFHYGTVQSGIDDITVSDSDAPAEYFNLQGIRVAEPQAGQIYIVRRGSNVSKELVK